MNKSFPTTLGHVASLLPPPKHLSRTLSSTTRVCGGFFLTIAGVVSDSELEDLETPPRYRPDSLEALCRATRFTQAEIKRIYRGFKAECPTGVVKEETFKMIYSQFFPQGGELPFLAVESVVCVEMKLLCEHVIDFRF